MVRIRTAIETITADMLQTLWNELDYRVDICRITNGAQINTLPDDGVAVTPKYVGAVLM